MLVLDNKVIGAFSLYDRVLDIASFGLVLSATYRSKGLGHALLATVKSTAIALGITTLRADVYTDNEACIRLLAGGGFRKIALYEINLT